MTIISRLKKVAASMSPLRNASDYGETQAFDDKELDGQNGGYLPFYKTAMEFPSEEAYKNYEE